MKNLYISSSSVQTKKIGEAVARRILKKGPKTKAVVLGLEGDLGAGKTTFLQGFAKGLGVKEKILSPTFVILKKFHIPNSKFQYFYHIDCYRIEKAKDLLDLGFKEIISDPRNIVAIEWPNKIKKIFPKTALMIKLYHLGKKERKVVFFE